MKADDSLGRGVDAALVLGLFFGIGYALDRWLGTSPWLAAGMFLLGSFGVFVSWKARYTATMETLEARRRDDVTRHRRAAPGEQTIEP